MNKHCCSTYEHLRMTPSVRVTSQRRKVTFGCKDHRYDAHQNTMTLGVEEFIHRYLLHVLPEGVQRIPTRRRIESSPAMQGFQSIDRRRLQRSLPDQESERTAAAFVQSSLPTSH